MTAPFGVEHRNTYALGGPVKLVVFAAAVLAQAALLWGLNVVEWFEDGHVLDFGGDD